MTFELNDETAPFTLDDFIKVQETMKVDFGRQPNMIIVSPWMYARLDWEYRKHDIFRRNDFNALVAPRFTRAQRWVKRKRRDVRWWYQDRHPEKYL